MYVDRDAPRRLNRGSLGLSIGIVGPLLAVVMLASPTVRAHLPEPPLKTWFVPPAPPPPRPEPLPQLQVKVRPTPPIDLPIPKVATEPKVPFTPPPQPPAPPDGGALGGTGTAPVAVEPVKPASVLTIPQIDGRYARDFQPLYPPAEQRAGRDGLVTLKVLVGADGRVREVQQLTATSDEFWRATQKQALARWRFTPATRDGIPVDAWRTMTVRFRMDE